MQAAGHLVAAPAELAPGVKDGKHHRHGGQAGFVLHAHGNAPAVVPDKHHVSRQQPHIDLVAKAGQGLVNGIVHNLVHQVVQSPGTGGADIHAGTLPHRLQSLQNLDLVAVIGFLGLCHICHFVDFQAKPSLQEMPAHKKSRDTARHVLGPFFAFSTVGFLFSYLLV